MAVNCRDDTGYRGLGVIYPGFRPDQKSVNVCLNSSTVRVMSVFRANRRLYGVCMRFYVFASFAHFSPFSCSDGVASQARCQADFSVIIKGIPSLLLTPRGGAVAMPLCC